MLTRSQQYQKRLFDLLLALIGLGLTGWLILLAWAIASLETRSNGLFMQRRVGQGGRLFWVFKIKTMRPIAGLESSVTTADDPRITRSGVWFRRTKIDELPQLINVLLGSMSFVGARPDVEGFADRLEGEDRVILSLPPGITGPASLKYKEEERILAEQSDPEEYNRRVIWPDKVAINRAYIQNWSLRTDIGYIIQTILG